MTRASVIARSPRPPAPVVAAWGAGVDSTAMIIELVARGEPPDVVLMAQTRSERPETDAFVPIFRRWMDAHGVENHLVCYEVRRFKHWPPYDGLLENLLTNATLPSIAFNRSGCSLGPAQVSVSFACGQGRPVAALTTRAGGDRPDLALACDSDDFSDGRLPARVDCVEQRTLQEDRHRCRRNHADHDSSAPAAAHCERRDNVGAHPDGTGRT